MQHCRLLKVTPANKKEKKLMIEEEKKNTIYERRQQKSRTQETPNLSTDAVSSTDIFASAGVKKRAYSIFFGQWADSVKKKHY